jgi:Subtilase family
MNMLRFRRLMITGCTLSALAMLGGCGGGGGSVATTPTPQPVPPPSPPPAPPPPPPPTGFNTAEYRNSNGAVQAGALAAYDAGATGTGVTAAVIDSGVAQTNPEFAGRIHPASADLAGNRGIGDEGGHGTAVSDVLLGAKDDSGIQGIAFNATLLVARTDTPGSCANTDPEKGCSHDDNAIARGVDLAVTNNARVINISLGGSPANNTLRNAIGRATAAGVVIVISGGNAGVTDPAAAVNPDPLAQIANDSIARNLVIIAGALDSTNAALRDFSNKAGNGQTHYLGALGSRVLAIDQNGTLFRFSGTSFSAPIISGSVALLAQAFPNLTGAQIVDLLFTSATDLGVAGVDGEFGYGALNLAKAFQPKGGASLAGSATPVTIGATGIASPAMGDGGQTGSSAVILDGYGRAFDLPLSGGFRAAARSSKLAQGLASDSRSLVAGNGVTGFSVSLSSERGGLAVDHLLLSVQDQARARALAGSVVTKLGPRTSFALGISTSGLALARNGEGHRSPAFLMGRAAGDGLGFDSRAKGGLALIQKVAGFTISAAAESGTARLWDSAGDRLARPGWRGYRYGAASIGAARSLGPLRLGLRGTWLDEAETILGGKLGSLYSAGGAQSWFADARADWQAGPRLNFSTAWRQGGMRIAGGNLHPGADWVQSNAWSFDATRTSLIKAGDEVSLRIAQPLRISRGHLSLLLPTSYDYATLTTGYGTGALNLAPTGREIDVEALYARALWGGQISGNFYLRRDPGNIDHAPNDIGVALRFTKGL